MQEIETICPYTGLRSFTEEESLYFKGREEHILKVTAQLEEKKFMMVTGASGDGKSSLIFAGLIPQARAGFFKAKYSNWYVADFRPERSPLKNMARSISTVLELDATTTEVELSRGFSSLVDLYKSSNRFIDKKSNAWEKSTEENKSKSERQAGNLLILIDQFEEFFTNPENFPGGVPSQESRLLLNIILETIKISLKENLPIYVVCTMRSDYIGQCAAFRGLPEFIGFSQFFVPRLQRKELRQVIEEPAILSGNKISNRLIDRLIFDLEEGTDQLPILQHALKQIWKAADHGQEEMDLIHYAMVGGMHGNVLPKEFIDRFQVWKEKLPEYEKRYLETPGLSNVLDIHANKLYEEAADYCNRNGDTKVTSNQAKFIIAMSFACLTRIDESKAVRNRMTLEEITRIINVPQFTTHIVGAVLSIFREPENTLIRPFIDDEEKSGMIEPSSVIDITHEALIRNWKLLKKWSDQEYEFYVTYLDFQQQVKRWIDHEKSEDFLLPIGPLTYFENWYKKCRPNKFWINRYHVEEPVAEKRLKQSELMLKNAQNFLRKSALRLLITRSFMKYGAGRIGVIVGLVVILVLGVYFINQWRIRKNEYVLEQILTQSETLLTDKEATVFAKSPFIVEAEILRPGFFKNLTAKWQDQQKIDAAIDVFRAIVTTEFKGTPPLLLESIVMADSLIQTSGTRMDSSDMEALKVHLNNLNDLVRNQSYFIFQRSNDPVKESRNRNAKDQAHFFQYLLSKPAMSKKLDKKAFHIAIVDALNYKGFKEAEIDAIIDSISPLESSQRARQQFAYLFPTQEKITTGFSQNISHNGGYQMLAYLYASHGNVNKTLQCLDSLKKYNQNYDKAFINSTHVSAYFLMYDHSNAFKEFIKAYTKEMGIPAHTFVREILNTAGVMYVDCVIKFITRGNINDNLVFLDDGVKKELFNINREFIRLESKSPDELNFNLAILDKLAGVLIAKRDKETGIANNPKPDSLFQSALAYYTNVSPSFLNEQIEVQVQLYDVVTQKRTVARRQLFLYPDHFKIAQPLIQPTWFRFYDDTYFKFMIRNSLFSKLYKSKEDYQLLIDWINSYFDLFGFQGNGQFLNYPDLSHSTFLSLDSVIDKSGYDLDDAWIKMRLIKDYFDEKDTANAFHFAKTLKFKEFEKARSDDRDPFHFFKISIAGELAIAGKHGECMKIVQQFSNRKNRVTAYSRVAAMCQLNQKYDEARVYLDSANIEMSRLKNFQSNGPDFRMAILEMLTFQNKRESNNQALGYIGSMEWFNRTNGVGVMVRCYSRIGEYKKAVEAIPSLASVDDLIGFYRIVLVRENLKLKNDSGEWASFYKHRRGYGFINFQNDLVGE